MKILLNFYLSTNQLQNMPEAFSEILFVKTGIFSERNAVLHAQKQAK